MSVSTRSFSRLTVVAALAAVVSYAQVREAAKVVWLDFDMQSIAEPKTREEGFYDNFFKNQLIEQTKQITDLPRWARTAAGRKKPAANVNALDEVPDSSWYTNRHRLKKMSIAELVRGPDQSAGPDFSKAVITRAKTGGVTPGLQIKDKKGDTYIIKFDNANYPELQSGAELIATKILYASGYNTPENYLGVLDVKQLEIGDKVEMTDPATKLKRAFTRDDLDEMLRRCARLPDGRYRVLASKLLSGKPKGPFPQIGLRRDDPNDLIPHEHRRELRGLRVIASWINHWDMKEENALDMYVEENGRKFLRHYLIDFGSTLGAGQYPTEYFRGREYAADLGSMTKELFTLGLFKSADEKRGLVISPAVGMFTAEDFSPAGWKTTYPVMAFDNMTAEDAVWGARIMLSFTEPELRSIVETAQYTDPKDTDYVLRTLMERRTIVARHWFRKGDALADFSIQPTNEGVAVKFRDVMVDSHLAEPRLTEYTYQVKGPRFKSEKTTTRDPMLLVDRAVLGAAIERAGADTPVEITIWTTRDGLASNPVRVYFDWNTGRDALSIRRISRG